MGLFVDIAKNKTTAPHLPSIEGSVERLFFCENLEEGFSVKLVKKILVFLFVTAVFLEIGSYAFIYFKNDPISLRFPRFVFFQEINKRDNTLNGLFDFWHWDSGEKFGSWHKPNTNFIHEHEIEGGPSAEYTTNSFGMHDVERSRESSKPRIMFFGDSFTDGDMMPDFKRATNLIENIIGYEVLNFGKGGSGTFQQSLYYEHFSSLFRHDVVCIGLFPGNDFLDMKLNNNPLPHGMVPNLIGKYPNYSSELRGTVTSPTTKTPFARGLRQFWANWSATARVLGYIQRLAKPGHSGYWDFEPDEWDMFRYSIEQFIKTANGKPLVVFIFPYHEDFLRYEKEGRKTPPLIQKMDELSKQLGFIYVDMFPGFYAKGGDPRRFFLVPYDPHWSEEGNRVAAEIAARVIKEIIEKLKTTGDSK